MSASHILEGWMAKPVPAASKRLFLKANARAEFEAEAMPHLDDLFRTALRMTGDRARADDAVQETYLQAWKSFGQFEKGTNCRAWLFRILFYCVNHQRRKLFRFPLVGDAEEILESTPSGPEPVTEALRDEQILGALDSLPPDYRAAVVLVDVEEFGYKEAAEILGIPIGTVMSRLSRARRKLRELLADTAKSYGIGNRGERKGVRGD
jgi:RNA polymerase sigma-70 factor (ECF subfamily)